MFLLTTQLFRYTMTIVTGIPQRVSGSVPSPVRLLKHTSLTSHSKRIKLPSRQPSRLPTVTEVSTRQSEERAIPKKVLKNLFEL